jgi:hypothetical protein
MADNVDSKVAANVPVATDVVTYSGDAGQNVQLVKPVHVIGAEGSKTTVDQAHAEDEASADGHAGYAMLAVRKATPANTSNADGDYEFAQMSAGRLWTSATVDAALPAGTNNIGDVDVLTVPAPLSTTGGGTEATSLRVTLANDSTGLVSVDDNAGSLTVDAPVGTPVAVRLSDGAAFISTLPVSLASVPSHAVTNAGTFAVQTAGDVAHDTGDSGAPSKIGGVATAAVSGATLVTAGDRTNLYAGLDGVLITRQNSSLEDIVTGNASNTDGTSFQVIAAGAAGIIHRLTAVTITNTSTASTYCEIKDGTTVKWTVPVPAQGGATIVFPSPIAGTAATAWNCDPAAATTTIICSMSAFKSKV